jgi:hypothetical protein
MEPGPFGSEMVLGDTPFLSCENAGLTNINVINIKAVKRYKYKFKKLFNEYLLIEILSWIIGFSEPFKTLLMYSNFPNF